MTTVYELSGDPQIPIEFFFSENDSPDLYKHPVDALGKPIIDRKMSIRSYPNLIIRQFLIHWAGKGLFGRTIANRSEDPIEQITPFEQGNTFRGKIDYYINTPILSRKFAGLSSETKTEMQDVKRGHFNIEGIFRSARHLHPIQGFISVSNRDLAPYNSALITFDITKISKPVTGDDNAGDAEVEPITDDFNTDNGLMYRSVQNPDSKAGMAGSVMQIQKPSILSTPIEIKDPSNPGVTKELLTHVIPVTNFVLYDGAALGSRVSADKELINSIINTTPGYESYQRFKMEQIESLEKRSKLADNPERLAQYTALLGTLQSSLNKQKADSKKKKKDSRNQGDQIRRDRIQNEFTEANNAFFTATKELENKTKALSDNPNDPEAIKIKAEADIQLNKAKAELEIANKAKVEDDAATDAIRALAPNATSPSNAKTTPSISSRFGLRKAASQLGNVASSVGSKAASRLGNVASSVGSVLGLNSNASAADASAPADSASPSAQTAFSNSSPTPGSSGLNLPIQDIHKLKRGGRSIINRPAKKKPLTLKQLIPILILLTRKQKKKQYPKTRKMKH